MNRGTAVLACARGRRYWPRLRHLHVADCALETSHLAALLEAPQARGAGSSGAGGFGEDGWYSLSAEYVRARLCPSDRRSFGVVW